MKRNFLADENAMEDRRSRALNRFLVVTPLVLLLTVGAVGHAKKPPHAGAQSDPVYDKEVLAYRDRVAAASRVRRKQAHNPIALRSELVQWRDGFRSGQLRAIPPIAYEDHLRDGPRGEIVHNGLELVDLSFGDVKARSVKDPLGAADEALTAAEVSKGLENFELQSKLLAMIPLRRSLLSIKEIWPRLSEDDRRNLAWRIKDLKTEPGEVRRLAKIEWANVGDYIRRQQIDPTDKTRTPEKPSDYLIQAVEHSDEEVSRTIDELVTSA